MIINPASGNYISRSPSSYTVSLSASFKQCAIQWMLNTKYSLFILLAQLVTVSFIICTFYCRLLAAMCYLGSYVFSLCRAASQHQFWVPIEVEEEVENEQLLAESKSRYISFPGSFTPVTHYCRAPLGNGKLCQRQDRLKVSGQTNIYICFCFL